LLVHLLDVPMHESAERCQIVLTAETLEQRSTEFHLQILDGARERRLRDVALLRRAREVARLGNRQEILQLMELHRFPRSQAL
jgi:hypothetical protein